ncbi:MAG: LacI family transcriptional regulator [Spirochaetes bacterium]|nr:LacI family transcriptional regulator [Spirochaetota bacterium]
MGKTIKDVAVAAGVSTATVSRVLAPENPVVVREATRARVMTAAEELGFRVNYAARSLKLQATMTIGVVFPELANEFFLDVAKGIEREIHKSGYTMLLSSSRNSLEEEKRRISMLAERMVDGILIVPAGAQGGHLAEISQQGMPMIMVDRIAEGTGLEAVVSDNEEGAFSLTQALLADGYRRIAFVGGQRGISSAQERLNGYLNAMLQAQISPPASWICRGGMDVEDGYSLLAGLLKKKNPPDAAVAVNILVHLGMERCLLEMRGQAPPLVIAGFDKALYSPFLPACRYTASQDAVGMGEKAGSRIVEKIREKKEGSAESIKNGGGKNAEKVIRLPVIISRAACGTAINGGK